MSPRVSPLTVPVTLREVDAFLDDDAFDEERPRMTRQLVESLEDPASNRAEAVWAEEVAEQIVAFWEGRAEAIPFEQALAKAQERQAAFHDPAWGPTLSPRARAPWPEREGEER
jgi:hypothetical protein